MQYKKFKDSIELSRLGMGNMRLPVMEDKPGHPIDYEKAKAIIDQAIRMGVNYFDTAYIYHGGESERFTGKALAEYPRNSFYVADKFNFQANPDYRVQFKEQLDRLQMDYIDFYLLHGIQDYFAEAMIASGCIAYFDDLKKQGKIRYLGFSFHSTPAVLTRMLEVYAWDFVQIQMNYYDWLYGDAKPLYEILTKAGIPVMVMEPVHGGMLANLNPQANKLLQNASPERSIASWAMRWVMGYENVQVILSGMSNKDQLHDNIQTISENRLLTADEHSLIEEACAIQHKDVSVACTDCKYCIPHCPQELDIPRLLRTYNEAKIGGAWRLSSLSDLAPEKMPSACIECGACVAHCPQSIETPQYLKQLTQMMA